MEPLKTLGDLQRAIHNKWDLFHVVNGRTYPLDVVTALNLKVIDVLGKIKDGTIFYRPE